MFRHRLSVFLGCCLLVSCQAKKNGDPSVGDPDPALQQDVRLVREHLVQRSNACLCGNGAEVDDKRMNAFEEGFCEQTLSEKRVFAACEVMLTNPRDDDESAAVLLLLSRRKGNRSRFVAPAVEGLKHADEGVRAGAATLLGKIGSPNEVPALRDLLSDPDEGVVMAVASALVALGGQDELNALDRWLAGPGREERYDFGVRDSVTKARADLAKRLALQKEKR
jgi:HEAT repeat protein